MKEATPPELAALAHQDSERIRTRIYILAGRLEEIDNKPRHPLSGQAVRVRDAGPKICMKQGIEAFKASYCCAEDALYQSSVVQILREGGWLEVAFYYCIDAYNPFGDWGRFIWQITRVYEIT